MRSSAIVPTGAPRATHPPAEDAREAAARRRAGFERFYRAEYNGILAVIGLLTGDRGIAEDVVQEAFAAAYHRWATVGRYDRPGAWVRRVALNRAVSGLRRRRNERRALERVGTRATTGDTTTEPPDEALWTAVRRLPARQAQVVALVYVEDRSVADVAAILGCRVGSVKQHLARARARLAEELTETGDGEGRP
jgi:RNA polymerase sigma-70 factor (ECF subfamily)